MKKVVVDVSSNIVSCMKEEQNATSETIWSHSAPCSSQVLQMRKLRTWTDGTCLGAWPCWEIGAAGSGIEGWLFAHTLRAALHRHHETDHYSRWYINARSFCSGVSGKGDSKLGGYIMRSPFARVFGVRSWLPALTAAAAQLPGSTLTTDDRLHSSKNSSAARGIICAINNISLFGAPPGATGAKKRERKWNKENENVL